MKSKFIDASLNDICNTTSNIPHCDETLPYSVENPSRNENVVVDVADVSKIPDMRPGVTCKSLGKVCGPEAPIFQIPSHYCYLPHTDPEAYSLIWLKLRLQKNSIKHVAQIIH